MTLEPWKAPKTNAQLAKIHAMNRDFAISQGKSVKHMKAELKFLLGYTEFIPMSNGKTREVPLSFEDASKEEMSEMIERLIVLAIEFNVELKQ